jgi:hypothetical protein
LPPFQLLYPAVQNALAKLDLKWIEFDKFLETDKHNYKPCLGYNAKGNSTCNFIDLKTKHPYEALLKKVNTSCTRKRQRHYRHELYSRPGTKDLALMDKNANISNYYFNNSKNFMNEGLMKFLLKARSRTLWTPERKHNIMHEPNTCPKECGQVGTLMHILNACVHTMNEITIRHNDVVAILAQQLKKFSRPMIDLAKNKKKSFKMKLGWNSTIGLPYGKKEATERNESIDPRFEEEARRKPDLWYYKLDEKTVKNESIKVLQ